MKVVVTWRFIVSESNTEKENWNEAESNLSKIDFYFMQNI